MSDVHHSLINLKHTAIFRYTMRTYLFLLKRIRGGAGGGLQSYFIRVNPWWGRVGRLLVTFCQGSMVLHEPSFLWGERGGGRRPFPSRPFGWFLRREGGRRLPPFCDEISISRFWPPAENGLRGDLSGWISLQNHRPHLDGLWCIYSRNLVW